MFSHCLQLGNFFFAAFLGDQFDASQQTALTTVFLYFYMGINTGSVMSTLLTPVIRSSCSYSAAFAMPAVLVRDFLCVAPCFVFSLYLHIVVCLYNCVCGWSTTLSHGSSGRLDCHEIDRRGFDCSVADSWRQSTSSAHIARTVALVGTCAGPLFGRAARRIAHCAACIGHFHSNAILLVSF